MITLLVNVLPTYLLPAAYRLSIQPKRLLLIPKPAGPNSESSRCRYLAARTEDATLRVMERVARIELAPTAWKAEVLPLNYTRVFSNPLIHRVPTYSRGSALLLSRLPFALKPSQDSFSNILPFFACSTCFALTGVAPNGLSVLNGGGGRIRTTEAFASDLQSDPFDRSGTPPFSRR